MKNQYNLKGKVIILTGGSGFLGSQFTPFLKNMGAKVYVMDNKSIKPVDITVREQVDDFVKSVFKKERKIDGLVHAAAMDAVPGNSNEQFSPYDKFPLGLWDKEISVNLTGGLIVTQSVVSYMKRNKNGGSIVFISSDLGMIAPDNSIYDIGKYKDIAYITSKAGVMGLMRAWASFLGPYKIRVNALVPGGMRNKQSDDFAKKNGSLNMLGRMSFKGEYNGALSFLLSDDSSFITGSPLIIDGGRIYK
jgi:NAD(P)-dependent dehydrogenase (short-subunit alcohol dehydrogenase family)